MSVQRLGGVGLAALRERSSDRDLEVVAHVAALRLMSAHQIEAVHFPPERYATTETAARCCRRALLRLVRDRLLVRAGRRLGGVRAGSSSFLYLLGPVGQRLLDGNDPRRRLREPSERFIDHTLAVSQLVVDLIIAARAGTFELLGWQSEPASWRPLPGLGPRSLLRPDLFVALGVGEYEFRWLIEVDRDTAHLPAVMQKCRLYERYYRAGVEQAEHGVFPRVIWIAPDVGRVTRLRDAIGRDRHLTSGLFVVATDKQALGVLARGAG